MRKESAHKWTRNWRLRGEAHSWKVVQWLQLIFLWYFTCICLCFPVQRWTHLAFIGLTALNRASCIYASLSAAYHDFFDYKLHTKTVVLSFSYRHTVVSLDIICLIYSSRKRILDDSSCLQRARVRCMIEQATEGENETIGDNYTGLLARYGYSHRFNQMAAHSQESCSQYPGKRTRLDSTQKPSHSRGAAPASSSNLVEIFDEFWTWFTCMTIKEGLRMAILLLHSFSRPDFPANCISLRERGSRPFGLHAKYVERQPYLESRA